MDGPLGYVVSELDVEPNPAGGDTARTRVTIDRSTGCEVLEQRVTTFARGRSLPRSVDGKEEVLYVVSGRGSLVLDGSEHALEPDMGVFVAAGERYEIDNPGPDELRLVSVSAPAAGGAATSRRAVRYADQPPIPAPPNREFRYLVDRETGCREVTQFIGLIPPGRVPMHDHSYDEVVYVVSGEGVLHLGGRDTPLGPGSCIHLPPRVEHCLENTGGEPLRVLGVFHPAGDPASRASGDGNN